MKALTIAEALGEGIISVPETLWDGIERTGEGLAFWNKEEEIKIGRQNDRAYVALKGFVDYGLANYNSPVEKAVRVILEHFYASLTRAEQSKIEDAAIKKGYVVAGKMITKVALSKILAKKIVSQIVASAVVIRIYKFSVSVILNLLAMQGLLYKAGEASDRLKAKFPKIWQDLRQQNLDMVYFLIEKPMSRYLEAIRLHRLGFNAVSL